MLVYLVAQLRTAPAHPIARLLVNRVAAFKQKTLIFLSNADFYRSIR